MVKPSLKSAAAPFAVLSASCAWILASGVGPRICLDAERGAGAGTAAPERLRTLLERRAKLTGDMGAIIAAAEAAEDGAGRDLTAEEKARFDEMRAQRNGLEERIARLEDQTRNEAGLDASRGSRASTPQLVGTERFRRGPEGNTQFESFGEFMHAVRFRRNDQRLASLYYEDVGAAIDDAGQIRAESRMDDGPSGGFAIPPQFRAQLLSLPIPDAVVRSRANVLEAGSPPDAPITMPALDQTGAAPGNWFGGVQVQWIGEGGAKPPTDMKLREITLTPHEVAGCITVTDKLLRNWQSASSILEQQLRNAMAQAEDFAFISGNGVAKPLGYLAAGALYKQPRAQANKIAYMDLVNMLARLLGSKGVWVYSSAAEPQLMALQNPSGQYIWSASAVTGQPNTLLGLPAIKTNRAPLIGAPGDIALCDFGQYLIKDGSGPFVAASEHALFTLNKTIVKAFWNVDGALWVTAPVATENGFVQSPFVALDVPSA